MLDFDLAALYQVETRVLKQAVRRNMDRFPDDFLLRLSPIEFNTLIISGVSQIVIPPGYNAGGADVFAFTEQGVAMLSSILRSKNAVNVNISIMRAFVAMRNYIMCSRIIDAELSELRAKLELLERNDEDNLEAINDLSEDVRSEIDAIYPFTCMILRVLLQIEEMFQVSADSWRITLEYRVYTLKKASDVPRKRLFLVHHCSVIWKISSY